jgi:hypothetical protein
LAGLRATGDRVRARSPTASIRAGRHPTDCGRPIIAVTWPSVPDRRLSLRTATFFFLSGRRRTTGFKRAGLGRH